MSISNLKKASLAAGAMAVTTETVRAADKKAVAELIASAERYHPSEPWQTGPIADYASHYDDGLRQMVEGWDGELIERFGYEFSNDA